MCNTQNDGGAVGTVLIENERVRVTRWDFPNPGDCTGWHRHDYDYVVVPLFDGDLRIENGTETVISRLNNGGSYFQQAGVSMMSATALRPPAALSRSSCLRPALGADNADGGHPVDDLLHWQAG